MDLSAAELAELDSLLQAEIVRCEVRADAVARRRYRPAGDGDIAVQMWRRRAALLGRIRGVLAEWGLAG